MKYKDYILTNSCYWHPTRKKRSPHYIEVVDLKTGEVKHIKSGARLRLIDAKIEDAD